MKSVVHTANADAGLPATTRIRLVGAVLDHSAAANASLKYETSGGDIFVLLRTDGTFPDRFWFPDDEVLPVRAIYVTLSAGTVIIYYEEI